MNKLREWVKKELEHLETIRMDIDADVYVERKQLLRRFLEEINTIDEKEGIEDLNDIFKEPDETVTLTIDQTSKHFNVAVTDDDLLLDKKFENNWNKLKEKIEIERAAIKASEDDGLIRVGQFRTLNSIDNFIKELEG